MARKKTEEGSKEEQQKADLGIRISQIRQTFFDDNNRLFAKKLCTNEQALSQICSGKRYAGIEIVQRIVNNMPDINADWLLTGRAKMTRTPTPLSEATAKAERTHDAEVQVALLRALLSDKERQIAECYQSIGQLEYQLQQQKEKVASLSAETSEVVTLPLGTI